ncbi:MAG: DUF4238 domain-containing protein [Terracidiphilus sp.]
MPPVGKKLNHFVSRFYLGAWAGGEYIFCLMRGKVFRPNLMGVASENYFYRLQELTDEDLALIGRFIDESPEPARETYRQIVRRHMAPIVAKKVLEEEGGTPQQFELAEKLVREINEDLHTAVEESFNPFITSMIQGDISFLDQTDTRAQFYGGLNIQYTRTKFIRGTMRTMPRERFDQYMRLSNLLVIILALNVGASMFGDADNRIPYLLENKSTVPFVTADQPIINLAANPTNMDPVERFELYYPLSPIRALLLLEPKSRFIPKSLSVSEQDARWFNLRIAANAFRQVFSNLREELEAVNRELPDFIKSL